MKHFGKFHQVPRMYNSGEDGAEDIPYLVLLQDGTEFEWKLLTAIHPFDRYVATDAEGNVLSMEARADASQLPGFDLYGFNLDEIDGDNVPGSAGGKRYRQVVRNDRVEIRELTRAEIYTPLTRKQFFIAAFHLGIDKTDIQTAIAGLSDPLTRMLAQIEFDESQTFERDNHVLAMVAEDMNVLPANIDGAWLQALGAS